MGSCFPGSTSLLCSPVFCKYSLRYLVFVKFLYCMKKKDLDQHAQIIPLLVAAACLQGIAKL